MLYAAGWASSTPVTSAEGLSALAVLIPPGVYVASVGEAADLRIVHRYGSRHSIIAMITLEFDRCAFASWTGHR